MIFPFWPMLFFNRIKLKNNKKIQGITNEAMKLLMEYAWPGNVRELKSAFEFAFVTCQNALILPDHLPPNVNNAKAILIPVNAPSLSREELKKQRLVKALEQTNGNQSEAAAILGISRVTVWNQMKKFGINLKRGVDV